MTKLHLSLSGNYPEPLQQALELFAKETRIQVDVEVLEHQERSLLTNFAIHKVGPDISEVGSTWLGNLVSMAAIRPFSERDVWKVGGQSAFVNGNWETGIRNNQIYGIPWRGDVRVINYRRDLLAKAGVDEKTAFSSSENWQLAKSPGHFFKKRIACRKPKPVAFPKGPTSGILHLVDLPGAPVQQASQ